MLILQAHRRPMADGPAPPTWLYGISGRTVADALSPNLIPVRIGR